MPTVKLNVKLKLPEDVERKAREAGLFTGEKIGELIEAEVRRQRQGARERLASQAHAGSGCFSGRMLPATG